MAGESWLMAGGRSARGSRRHAAAASRSVVVPFPRGAAGARLDLVRFVPSGRSLLITFVTVVAIGIAYWIVYATPVFAVERVVVRGAPPELSREVMRATRDLVGRSLVAVDADQVEGTLRALPAVAGVSVDRAFPDTLVVRVAPERAVAVVRRGRSAWLATGAGMVIREIETGTRAAPPAALAGSRRDRSGRGPDTCGAHLGNACSRRGARGRPRLSREGSSADRRRAHARAPTRVGAATRAHRGRRHEARHRAGGARARRRECDLHRRQRPAAACRRMTRFKSQVEA